MYLFFFSFFILSFGLFLGLYFKERKDPVKKIFSEEKTAKIFLFISLLSLFISLFIGYFWIKSSFSSFAPPSFTPPIYPEPSFLKFPTSEELLYHVPNASPRSDFSDYSELP